MKEQDKRAVEGMARCGISLEGLLEAFPKFDVEDVVAVYDEVNKIKTNMILIYNGTERPV
ncbi:MAG: hypothetical protein PUE92_09235 [Catenibacterium mitsuokai]|nr:hypothetical protein [Catenibacterium mitsuokai]MDD6596206.1 hypothetical protein [Catenibacterium mitsuokai]